MRGGEKCLEALCELFPSATVFTLVHVRGSVSETIERMDIHTSFVQRLPFGRKKYRSFLPLFPAAIEQFDLRSFDLVVSSSHCVAKGVIPGAAATHVCYCHTPMRYVWAMYDEYFGGDRLSRPARSAVSLLANYLRMWDVASSQRVDAFAANSENVRRRIWRYYRRRADVVFPPVDTNSTWLSSKDVGYFLIVSAFAPYKRIGLAIEAFNQLGERLVIIGTGQEEKRLKRAAGRNVEFLGWVEPARLWEYYANCRALVFPGEEDFGIVPVEAQCFGKPVIALGRGGALETVRGVWASEHDDAGEGGHTRPGGRAGAAGHTGVFFREQTPAQLVEAVHRFRTLEFDPEAIRRHALQFDRAVFKSKMKELVDRQLSSRAEDGVASSQG
ncbi:MAG: glycosyltransferase [Candidatus Eisenbacteria bacterium]|nr:glycosyltransferase [Candidatus Eisenbacteria bacterium]